MTAALTAAGCGAATASVGTSHAERPEGPVDLSLVTSDGARVELASQRGGVVLLFIVSTYDGVCQAAIRPVSSFTVAHLDTVVLGVIAQPAAETFAPLYAETFSPPFTVTYEPEGTIALGTSDLGAFEAVPTFVMLDAHGVVADTHVGWITDERLLAMYRRAVERGGIVTPDDATPVDAASSDVTPDAGLPLETRPIDTAVDGAASDGSGSEGARPAP